MIRFRAIELDDLPTLRDWRNELMEAGVVRETRYLNMLDQEAWLRAVTGRDSRDRMMAVECRTRLVAEGAEEPDSFEQAPLLFGAVGLTKIDWVRRHAEVSIFGMPHGCGDDGTDRHGHEMLTALCRYAFDTCGLRRVWGEVYGHNEASLRLFEKLGFTREGVLRQHTFHAGQWHDAMIFGLLADESKVR